MSKIEKFEDMPIWQKARRMCKEIYFEIEKSEKFKKEFRFREQILASSYSVMDNVAEGFERIGNKKFQQFLYIAKGSNGEFRSQLYRALDRNYINADIFSYYLNSSEEIGRMIMGFIEYFNKSGYKGYKYKSR